MSTIKKEQAPEQQVEQTDAEGWRFGDTIECRYCKHVGVRFKVESYNPPVTVMKYNCPKCAAVFYIKSGYGGAPVSIWPGNEGG